MRNPYAPAVGGDGAPDPDLAGAVSPRAADYETAIGPNSEYYRPRFEDLDANGSRFGWHWPAFFATSAWFFYRRMWLIGLLNFVYPIVVWLGLVIALALQHAPSNALFALIPLSWILLPVFATRLYWRRIRKLIDEIPAAIANDPARRAARLEVRGGVNKGAMVTAVVVMGLLTIAALGVIGTVAIPAYQAVGIRMQVYEGLRLAKPLQDDVREFYARRGVYPPDISALQRRQISGKYVSSMRVQLGSIVIEYAGQADEQLQHRTLILVPGTNSSREVVWGCGEFRPQTMAHWGPGPSGTTIPHLYLPKACR